MDGIMTINEVVNHIVWGTPAMALILGTGIVLSVLCGFPQFTHFGYMITHTLGKAFRQKTAKAGAVSPFKAMCTALAASIGTGNIAGVSGAIAMGGPGAVFWMWISALLGMCTKFAEVTLAVHYRERNANGDWVGGPMYYIRNGLGDSWNWLGKIFCLFGALAAFGIGNMAQVNTVAVTINDAVSHFVTTTAQQKEQIALFAGIFCAAMICFVVFGGIGRIGDVCALLVPCMAVVYLGAAAVVIVVHAAQIPAVLAMIVKGAFHPAAVAGGLAGVSVKTAITSGVGRGIFSNEAGLGSAPIAHAAADVRHPVEQGLFGIFEVFMDTIVICTVTALVVLLGVGVDNIAFGHDIGAALTIQGFQSVFGGTLPSVIVAVCLTLFALSTVLTWGLYGARCCEFLCGSAVAKLYQMIFALFAVVGATMELSSVWAIADTLNGLMALPNLVALLALSPVAAQLTRRGFKQ